MVGVTGLGGHDEAYVVIGAGVGWLSGEGRPGHRAPLKFGELIHEESVPPCPRAAGHRLTQGKEIAAERAGPAVQLVLVVEVQHELVTVLNHLIPDGQLLGVLEEEAALLVHDALLHGVLLLIEGKACLLDLIPLPDGQLLGPLDEVVPVVGDVLPGVAILLEEFLVVVDAAGHRPIGQSVVLPIGIADRELVPGGYPGAHLLLYVNQIVRDGLQNALGDEDMQRLLVYAGDVRGGAGQGRGVELGHQVLLGHELGLDRDVRIAAHKVRYHEVPGHVVDSSAIRHPEL